MSNTGHGESVAVTINARGVATLERVTTMGELPAITDEMVADCKKMMSNMAEGVTK